MDNARLNFSKSAHSYDDNAHIQREVARRLLMRLDYLTLKPKTILDLGSGTGFCGQQLQNRYPDALIINLDFSLEMCKISNKNKQLSICADINHLPIKANSVDLIVSNFTLQWCDNLTTIFQQLLKSASPEAVFLFSTVGFNSLVELRKSWATVDDCHRVQDFLDLHQIGDAIFQAGFQEPLLDIDKIVQFYPEVSDLLQEFKALGVTNQSSDRPKNLTGKNKFQKFIKAYEKLRTKSGVPLSWEIIYGYARKQAGIKFG